VEVTYYSFVIKIYKNTENCTKIKESLAQNAARSSGKCISVWLSLRPRWDRTTSKLRQVKGFLISECIFIMEIIFVGILIKRV